ncbi:hypothetical protein ORT97_23910 [Escherichia coli]|uniref:hypothetical protein n=1 Tax=Escherichia coli TaxID=562 RepID=UPI00225441FD|nr:hypothetical protein [Escherichia coli]MCX3205669.1 hypothetical protein [Escherichia coli]
MKQMSLIEMDGFLKGKCIPSDLKVNETNAEYLVRKFGELESKIALLEVQLKLSEAAERAWESSMMQACGEDGPKSVADKFAELEAKCAALAAENAALKAAINPEEIPEDAVEAFTETAIMDHDWDDTCSWTWVENDTDVIRAVLEAIRPETPATDAFLAEVRAQGVEMAACALDDVNQFNYANMLDDLAQKLRKEAAQ